MKSTPSEDRIHVHHSTCMHAIPSSLTAKDVDEHQDYQPRGRRFEEKVHEVSKRRHGQSEHQEQQQHQRQLTSARVVLCLHEYKYDELQYGQQRAAEEIPDHVAQPEHQGAHTAQLKTHRALQ